MSTGSNLESPTEDQADGRPEVDAVVLVWLRALGFVLVLWILALLLFWHTAASAVAQWLHSETYSHAFLVFPITMYLMWRDRDRILALLPAPNFWGLLMLAVLALGWIVAELGGILVAQQIALVAMLQVLFFTIVGRPATRVVLFPLVFLIFAVPFGEDLVRPLQSFTAHFAVKGLQVTGIPVFREGWLILTPSAAWEVAEACAGVRYVIPAVILGCLYSYGCYRSWRKRLCFIGFCFLAAILANGIRAYGIIAIAYITNNRIAVGADHVIAGWIFHTILVLSLFGIGLRWRDPKMVDAKVNSPVSSMEPGKIPSGWTREMVFAGLCALATLALVPLGAQYLTRPLPNDLTLLTWTPVVRPPWNELESHDAKWKPNFLGADLKLLKSYAKNGEPVHFFMAYYQIHQRQDAELISGGNTLIDPITWLLVHETKEKALVDGKSLSVDALVIRSNQQTRLLWTWYWVGGEFTSNQYYAKILELKGRLLRERRGSAVIAVTVDVDYGDFIDAGRTIQDFLHHIDLDEALNRLPV